MDTSTLIKPPRFVSWVGQLSPTYTEARQRHQEMAPKLEAAVTTLAARGDPDDIAVYLKTRNITGRLGLSEQCPLAHCLQRDTGIPNIRVAYTASIPHGTAGTTVMDLPGNLVELFVRFDRGAYSYLREPDRYGRRWQPT